MHNSIILTVGHNDPQTIEGQLAAASNPGVIVHKNPTGKLAKSGVGFAGILSILMPNTLFGGDIRDEMAVNNYSYAVMMTGDCDYAARVVGTVIKPLPEGTLLALTADGELAESADGTDAVFSLREAHTFVAGTLTVLLSVRKI